MVELSPCRENYSDDDSDGHHGVEEANGVTSNLRFSFVVAVNRRKEETRWRWLCCGWPRGSRDAMNGEH